MGSSRTWRSLKFHEWCHLLQRWKMSNYTKSFYTIQNYLLNIFLAGMDPRIWAGNRGLQDQEESDTNRLPVGHWPHVQEHGVSDRRANFLWWTFWQKVRRMNSGDIFYSYLGPRSVVAQLGNFYILFSGLCLKQYHKRFANFSKQMKQRISLWWK